MNKSNLKCSHCNQIGHSKNHRFELVGYHEWWDYNFQQRKKDSKKTPRAAVVERKMEEKEAETTTALIATSNHCKVLNISMPVRNSNWIIDSGATNYMTFDSTQVFSLKPTFQNIISTADIAFAYYTASAQVVYSSKVYSKVG